ncbi:MAG: hypothetical protein HY808_11240 [Nitrospirae bacterium]|nr:hypothetical protein [Nitrospirota bacterium]
MSLINKILMIVIAASLLTGAYACKKEGPLERAGKKIDKAAEDVKKKVEDVTK